MRLYLPIVAVFLVPCVYGREIKRTIANELGMEWPWELVYMDFDAGTFGEKPVSVRLGNVTRPCQVEKVGGKERVWFIASIVGEGTGGKRRPPKSVEVVFTQRTTPATISMRSEADAYLINNGVYEFRINRYAKTKFPQPLDQLRHWLGGMRIKGTREWDGRGRFLGTSVVEGVDVEVVRHGPVFIDLKLTYRFANSAPVGTTESMDLQPGKQTYKYKPGVIPHITLPKRPRHYEAVLRFVAGDPWVEVDERYHLPRDLKVPGWGIHMYFIHWGAVPKDYPAQLSDIPAAEHIPVDTAMWMRWFLYDQFGGNSDLGFVPARPRPDQKGRPFALMRPCWNQGGGGAQDFFLTRGGSPGNPRKKIPPSKSYNPDAPAIGAVAGFPSKWTGPYVATIAAYARESQRGIRAPLVDGGRSGRHYGTRAYALCVGPRRLFDSTAKLNSLVRRHVDWTLVAQINKYKLSWPRRPELAGGNILISRERLLRLRKQLAANVNNAETRIVREEQKELENKLAAAKDKKARKKVESSTDWRLLQILLGKPAGNPRLPDPSQYLGRRYQDDANNPTNYGNRRLVNGNFPVADLLSLGRPFGGPAQAAIGYIYTDLDAWIGYHNGWGPGNPNFHTDKYIASAFAGAAMSDHPHADEWLEFARANLADDMRKVLLSPDGVGYECPGYSAFSLHLQLETARVFAYSGKGNPATDNPLVKKSLRWHRKMITPLDKRIARRHEVPHGDTHRWDSGVGVDFGAYAGVFKKSDPAFAAELMGTLKLLKDSGARMKSTKGLLARLTHEHPDIMPMDPMTMDWSSQHFAGFGAVMRSGFGTADESFVSFKAGRARHHYHNDELVFHYYSRNTPIALDYNCSYHPRGDHAALHNSMTFGRSGTVRHNKRGEQVEAMEQLGSTAQVGVFVSKPVADLVVAERSGSTLTLSPVDPHDAEFSRGYPTRKVQPFTHRRCLLFVKHNKTSPFNDYLVVRDETNSREPGQINVHLLARSATVTGNSIACVGQYDADMSLLFCTEDLRIEQRHWQYYDEWMAPPTEYVMKPGESEAAYAARMQKLAGAKKTLPLPGWSPRWVKRDQLHENEAQWDKLVEATHGKALMPPPNWNGQWLYGEAQLWLRVHVKPSASVLWVLYPHKRNHPAPKLIRDGDSVVIEVGGKRERVRLSSAGCTLERDGTKHVLMGSVPGLGQFR